MKKISTSTLSSIKYNRSNPEKLKEIIYGGKFETSKEAQMGIDFEQDLAIMNGNCDIIREIPDDIWYPNKVKMYECIKGCEWQKKVEKVITFDNEEWLLKGFIDFYKPGTIFDIKTTKKYIPNEMKFLMSTQHLIYFECTGESLFRYLINSWDNPKNIYEEVYKRKENNLDRIIFNIRVCRNILLENGLDFLDIQ